jgi:hypothetical protein
MSTKTEIENAMKDMKCYPIDNDEGNKVVDTVELYQLDDSSLAMENLSSMIVNFFIFIFLIVFSILFVPFFYENTFIGFVTVNSGSTEQEVVKAGSLRTLDWFINLILVSIIIGIVVDGNKNSNNTQSIIGIFSLIFLIIVNLIIFFLKIYNPVKYNFGITNFTPPSLYFLGTIFQKIFEIIKKNGLQIVGVFILLTGILFFISFLAFLALNISFFNPATNYPVIFVIGALLSLTAIKIFDNKP